MNLLSWMTDWMRRKYDCCKRPFASAAPHSPATDTLLSTNSSSAGNAGKPLSGSSQNTSTVDDKAAFKQAIDFTLKWEGGYVHHKDDPGGETKYGISKRSYPRLDIKKLTKDTAREIYYRDYWLPAKCDKKPYPVNCIHFDAAVNVGVSRAEGWYNKIGNDAEALLTRREQYYDTLVRRRRMFRTFSRGWTNRMNALRKRFGKG